MTEAQEEQTNSSTSWLDNLKTKIAEILSSWKLKVGLIVAALLGVFLLVFFWQHMVAVMGMKLWSSEANAQPIYCMMKDTNDDGYVSCSAMIEEQVVPLECGSSIFNVGCRVTYGSAAPPMRSSNQTF